MKKIIYVVLGLAVFAGSCKKDLSKDEKPLITTGPILDTLVGDIVGNVTVTRNAYLFGTVYVKPGATLTINPGITIFGSEDTNPLVIYDAVNPTTNKGTLLVEKGGNLIAAGTCNSPIVWTSDDKIPNGSRRVGDWGGIVIYGLATMHTRTGATTGFYEAFDVTPTDTRHTYGGGDDDDNSGTMTYNRIEFAGGIVTDINKEVNGLTLCAVGKGTTINHIEVLKSGDDAFELFGGAVNMSHLLAYATKDDDFDFDEGYHGYIQFIVGVRDSSADNSGSHLIEIDNDASFSNFQPYTDPIISNATLVGPFTRKDQCPGGMGSGASYFDGLARIRRNTSLRLVNSYAIAVEMPFNLVFTPTTQLDLLAPPTGAQPGVVMLDNIYQINAGITKVIVADVDEGDPTLCTLTNDPFLVGKLADGSNQNNYLNSFFDFNLGSCLENTSSTPDLNGGTDLTTLGLPFFVSTTERGGVTTTDNWTCAGVICGWISIDLD